MTQTAVFWGASDDLVEVEGIKGADEFGAYASADDHAVHWHGQIRSEFGRMGVLAIYTATGTWTFAPYLVEDTDEWPDWPIRISRETSGRHAEDGYSLRMEIDVPDDAELCMVGE